MVLYDRDVDIHFYVRLSGSDTSECVEIYNVMSENTKFNIEYDYDGLSVDELSITYTSPNGTIYYDKNGEVFESTVISGLISEFMADICAAFEEFYNTKFRYEVNKISDNLIMGAIPVRITFIEI